MTRYRTAFPSRRFSRIAVRLGLISVLTLLATVAAIMVLLSPLALPLLGDDGGTDWSLLSNIGQTYGAVSALLAALALGGVVGSLVLQSGCGYGCVPVS
ncbi:MAG: hypothetical protein GEU94_15610 [Micromonosporaceae bacterium]|nr:hypothetical protein [Micromonosporaceae bacterium]